MCLATIWYLFCCELMQYYSQNGGTTIFRPAFPAHFSTALLPRFYTSTPLREQILLAVSSGYHITSQVTTLSCSPTQPSSRSTVQTLKQLLSKTYLTTHWPHNKKHHPSRLPPINSTLNPLCLIVISLSTTEISLRSIDPNMPSKVEKDHTLTRHGNLVQLQQKHVSFEHGYITHSLTLVDPLYSAID